MPVLDAKALKTDRKGLAFLRAVLSKVSHTARPVNETGQPPANSMESPVQAKLTVRRRSAGVRA
jgi:hypothetical protein